MYPTLLDFLSISKVSVMLQLKAKYSDILADGQTLKLGVTIFHLKKEKPSIFPRVYIF